jgi:hypothetical protein
MSRSIRLRVLAGTFVLLAGLGPLAGCGDDGGTTVSTKDGKVKVDQDKVTVETSEGTATIGNDLPEGFPKDDVPLVDQKVVSGVKGSAGGPFAWSVVMTSTKAVEALTTEVTKGFGDAGYSTGQSTDLGDVSIRQFTNDRYDVGVTIARTGDGVTITYLVKNKS